ncbi:hypothetical protein G7072_14660 [Nocardioides sp. HDW12B]|uniref:hypothetical protein n=1 Tax=Nocardioides sp. HDW12B TaxID=2714939 RepID=UPI00140B4613|nr:hypothetical protein [Nocardioides sp. HDW12B]QIK67416.1 hypothetical protein G7072_14660 [Nocardioides sp. HDW12B]
MRALTLRPSSRVARAATALLLGTSLAVVASGATTSADAARWAPADQAKINPGVMMYTAGAQCTGNFVFTDRRDRVYVGYAAHCAGKGEATDTNGCDTASQPLGTKVRFVENGNPGSEGTTVGQGTLAYSSWRTMRAIGTKSNAACSYNDFALVRVTADDVRKVNPSVPFFGGPSGVRQGGFAGGEQIFTVGNSSLRAGVFALQPKTGAVVETHPSGWSHTVYTLSPGIPGDSGSGFLDANGKAFGVLSTVAIAPLPASNGVSDLKRSLEFAQRHSGIAGLRLVRGTVDFAPLV